MLIARALALQPMPVRLKDLMLSLMEYLLMMMEEREGVGQKPLQLVISMSMS